MDKRVLAGLARPSNVVFDVDGCLIVGGQRVKGADHAVRTLRALGIRVLIATNNSTRTVGSVALRLSEVLEVPFDADDVVTSALAATALLGVGDGPVLVIGEDGIREAIASRHLAETEDPLSARCVIVGLDRSFDYDRIDRAASAVRHGARLIATNDDPTFPSGGPDKPGAGAMVAAVERASGAKAEVAGKPHRPMYDAVSARLAPGTTWMVGDRPSTDIRFALESGWTAIRVATGVTEAADIEGRYPADAMLGSVAELVDAMPQ